MPPSPLTQEHADLYQAINHQKAETQHGCRLALGRPRASHLTVIRSYRNALRLCPRRVVFLFQSEAPHRKVFGLLLQSDTLFSCARAQTRALVSSRMQFSASSLMQLHVHLVCVVALHGAKSTFAHVWGIKTSKLKLVITDYSTLRA